MNRFRYRVSLFAYSEPQLAIAASSQPSGMLCGTDLPKAKSLGTKKVVWSEFRFLKYASNVLCDILLKLI
jgi:hypothetical protein